MIIYIDQKKKIKSFIGVQNMNIIRSIANDIKDVKERTKEVSINRKKLSNKINELISLLSTKEVNLTKELLKTDIKGINIFKQKEISLSKIKYILDLRILLILQDSNVNSIGVLI